MGFSGAGEDPPMAWTMLGCYSAGCRWQHCLKGPGIRNLEPGWALTTIRLGYACVLCSVLPLVYPVLDIGLFQPQFPVAIRTIP